MERLLIPTLESKIRSIVKEEVGHLEKVMDARFEAVNSKMDARFESVNTRFEEVNTRFEEVNTRFEAVNEKIDSLEKRFPAVQELAEIKARLNQIEKASR